MKKRAIRPGIHWMGAVDWDRRLFDGLIPLPDGTSYNAYLIQGEEKIGLIDTVDPAKAEVLMSQLESVPRLDYIISLHAEQDHSGCIPLVLEKYPDARVICSERARGLLIDLLKIDSSRFQTVKDGDVLDLGGFTLQFFLMPWVHWPETMTAYLPEEKILFSCDFFGSHMATSDLYTPGDAIIYEAAMRYYAEIMMPFYKVIRRHLEKINELELLLIAPSHGPMYENPAYILDAYREWVTGAPKNKVVLPYVSMHGSTAKLVEHLVGALSEKGVSVQQFDLTSADLGKLAMSFIDAPTLVVGSSTIHAGPHPLAIYAASLANALRPRLRHATVVGSY
ncbi:MAG: FprA family A-type flavoprotein, partial [Anaerolineaceae bacterium]